MKRLTVERVVIGVVGLVASAALVLAASNFNYVRSEAERVSNTQTESCLLVGEPIRQAVIQLIEDQIETSANLDPSLFPDIPPDQFRELVRAQNTQRREVLTTLTGVASCAKRFKID